MGIDAQTFSNAFPKGFLSRVKGEKALHLLLAAAQEWPLAKELGPNFQITPLSATKAEIALLPLADPILIDVTHSGISAGFRSSNGGPGFHAAAVDLLDHLERRLGLTWVWQATNGDILDETGYAVTRDTAALNTAMAKFLGQLADICTDQPDGTDLSLCLPIDLASARPGLIAPLGPLPADWPDKIKAADPATLADLAAAFFVWPVPGCDAGFWQALLRAQLWQQAEWRIPATEADHLNARQIDHSYRKALASGTALPQDLTQTYAEWQQAQISEAPPAQGGIGYRKGLLAHQLYQSWSMRLPGYVRFMPDGENASFEHPAFWLGTQSLILDAGPGVFTFPQGHAGPDRTLGSGVVWRKTTIAAGADGSKTQNALIASTRGGSTRVLSLTLSSHEEWPFDHFDTWIETVFCPDLLPKTLH